MHARKPLLMIYVPRTSQDQATERLYSDRAVCDSGTGFKLSYSLHATGVEA